MMKKIIAGILSSFSLMISVIIYADFRGFDLGAFAFATNKVSATSSSHFILYNLPDALWMYSFCLGIIMIWEHSQKAQQRFWLGVTLFSGLSFEILQATPVISGIFDPIDLICIAIAFFLALMTSFSLTKIFERCT